MSRLVARVPPGVLPLAGVIVLFGASVPVTKLAVLHGAGPAWFALGRAGFSGLGASAILVATGRFRRPGRADLPSLLAVGLFQLAGFFALVHLALATVPAGRAAILSNATGIWTVPLSLLLGERVAARQWLAAGLGLLGVMAIVGPWAADGSSHAMLGNVLLLGAALSWSVAMVALRRRPPRMALLQMLPWSFALASLVLLPLALARPLGHWDGTAWAGLLFIGLIAGPAGTWCVVQATRLLPMVIASTGFLASPAVGLLLSATWLGEALTPGLILGSALILGGVAAAAIPWRRRA